MVAIVIVVIPEYYFSKQRFIQLCMRVSDIIALQSNTEDVNEGIEERTQNDSTVWSKHHTLRIVNRKLTAAITMMMASYPPYNELVSAPLSPSSSDTKIHPAFLRIEGCEPSCEQKQKPCNNAHDDFRKPAALPAGVNPSDVLCGRDKVSNAHIGNKNFRCIIERYREMYQSADCRDEKTNITCSVINKVRGSGGRFLKLDEATNLWEPVSEQYAREKVSHALRSAKDPNRPKVKKPRKTKEYIPTPEEEAAFRDALEEQRKIFQALLDNHLETEGSDANFGPEQMDDEGDDDDDWDFYQ